MTIVLASSSPRREEIGKKYGLNPIIISPNLVENHRDYEDPYSASMSLAFQKAYSVAKYLKGNEIVIAFDTLIYFKGKKLGKPINKEEALSTLLSLNNNQHSVITGFCILQLNKNKKIVDFVKTDVVFKNNNKHKLIRYVDSGEPLDKAGSYGIQGYGQLLVESIQGSYLNVVGFPIEKISDILENLFGYMVF